MTTTPIAAGPNDVTVRAQFERWYSNDGKWSSALERSGDGYKYQGADHAWHVWQAAVSQEREACKEACRKIAAQYPTDVWPEDGESLDCKSARMARLTAANCEREIDMRSNAGNERTAARKGLNMEQAPNAAGPLEASVGRMAGKCTKPLSYRQRDVLSKAPAEWGRLPPGIGCTNATLEALEKRGLVETRYCAEGGFVYEGRQHFGWQWRKTPNAELCGGPSGPSERAPGYASAPKTEE